MSLIEILFREQADTIMEWTFISQAEGIILGLSGSAKYFSYCK